MMAVSCPPCHRNFKDRVALSQHLRCSPAHTLRLECSTCHKSFTSEVALAQHTRDAHVKTSFECSICHRSFGSQDALQQHTGDPHTRTPREALRQHIRESPAHESGEALRQHIRNPPTAKLRFECGICRRSFSGDVALHQHIRNLHASNFQEALQQGIHDSPPRVPSHKYDVRDRSSDSQDALQQHIQALLAHASQPEAPGVYFDDDVDDDDQDEDEDDLLPRLRNWVIDQQKSQNESYYMFPTLHPSVAEEVAGEIGTIQFYEKDSDDTERSHQTHIMGRFVCEAPGCRRGRWGSRMVGITIRGYRPNEYNAIVYNQRCQYCEQIGTMHIDVESYVKRVARRLKIWAGVRVERPVYHGKSTSPHMRELCEACLHGDCREG